MSDRAMTEKRKKDFVGIYKPNRKNTGSCAQFKLGSEKTCMFLEVANQVGHQSFDWSKKINVKLGESDIGKMLSLFNCVLPLQQDKNKPDLEIFHKTPGGGNKTIKFKVQDNGYYMKVSHQSGRELTSVALPIGWDEAELIKIALTKGYEIILGW